MVLETSENVNNGNPSPLEALLAGAEGFPPMLDIPPDADDETMVELAIALSLQQDQQGQMWALLAGKKGMETEKEMRQSCWCHHQRTEDSRTVKCTENASVNLLSQRKMLISCSLLAGSSSSALGLQSLGLSGQAPSSSSLDAGTLSDTTASGNCSLQDIFFFTF